MSHERPKRPSPLSHLVTIYVARRDLVPVLKRELLSNERQVKLEEASILLDLYRAQTGNLATISLDGQGFTTLKQIEVAQMLSQPQVHRRVGLLMRAGRDYLEERMASTKTGPKEVRLSEKGVTFTEQYWARYKQLASSILAGLDVSQLRAHLSVNYTIQRRIHGWVVPRPEPPSKVAPIENLTSILVTAKDIRSAIQDSVVLPEDGLSVERADLLVFLHSSSGFRSFGEIEKSLVHSFSPSRHLISRWVGELGSEGPGYVETKPLPGKRMAAAITQKGKVKVEAILKRYRGLAEMLIAGVPKPDREAHLLVNRTVSESIRPRLKDQIAG